MNGNISYRDEVRRKLIHLSSLWMPLVMSLLPQWRWQLCAMFGVMLILNLIVEHAYAAEVPWIVRAYDLFFGGMLRDKPHKGQWIISGGPYVFASAFLSLLLFPAEIAACSMAVMLLGDTAAALIGRRFGRHKTVNGKSWEGVIAFVLAGWLGCALFLMISGMPQLFYLWAPAAVIPAAAAELFEKQLHFDDNFSIPLVTGLVLSIPVFFN